MKKRILLAGETFTISQSASQGFDVGFSSIYANGATHFLESLRESNYLLEQLPSERCETEFPRTLSALGDFSAIILSDIGALSLLFTPESRTGKPSINRLVLLSDYVEAGGALMMAGGYTSFQGMHGTARYHGTAVEACLPVTCLPHSDGLETPEGQTPQIVLEHPIANGLPGKLPPILGLNRVVVRKEAVVIAETLYRGTRHPLLAVRTFGKGRSLAWMTDIGPHWMSQEFLADPSYGLLMGNMMSWLCADI